MDQSTNPEELLENAGWMKGLARSLVGDDARADDVVQQTFEAYVKQPPRQSAAVGAWLARVVRNLSYRSHRENTRRERREQAVARPEAVSRDPSEILERAELQQQIVGAVLELDEPYRSTVILRYFEDLEPKQIAEEQGIPIKTVWTRLSRAMERLRVRLDEQHGGSRRAWSVLLVPWLDPTWMGVGAASAATHAASSGSSASATAVTAATTSTTAASGSVTTTVASSVASLLGVAMAQKAILGITVVAASSLMLGWSLGRSGEEHTAVVVDAPEEAPSRELELQEQVASLAQEVADVSAERDQAIRDRDLLRAKLAERNLEVAALKSKLEPSALADGQLPLSFGPHADLRGMVEADWDLMAEAIANMQVVFLDLVDRMQNKQPADPNMVKTIQAENSKLIRFAGGVVGQIPTHSPINGEFTNPLATANLMNAMLTRAELPLSASQLEQIQAVGETYDAEYKALDEGYAEDTLRLRKILEEIAAKRDIQRRMLDILTEEQLQQVAPDALRDLFQLDVLSPFVSALTLADPRPVTSAEDALNQLRKRVELTYDITPQQLEGMDDLFEAWARKMAPLLVEVPIEGVEYLYFDDALTAGFAYVELLEGLISRRDFGVNSRSVIDMNVNWFIPRLVPTP